MTDQITEMPAVDEPAEDETVTPAAGTEAAAAEGPKPITKHKVPDGIATPIEALNAMKQKQLVPADFPPQRMYGFVIDEVIAWWSRKGDRDKVKAEEKAAKALAKAEKDKQTAAAAAAKAAGQPAPSAPPVVGSEEAAEAGVTEDVEAE
jgi:hypothetical protein